MMTLRELALAYVGTSRSLIGEFSGCMSKDVRDLWDEVEREVNPLLVQFYTEPLTKLEVMGDYHYAEEETEP